MIGRHNNALTAANIATGKNAVAFLSMLGRTFTTCLVATALTLAGCGTKLAGDQRLTKGPPRVGIAAGTWVGHVDNATITLSLAKDGRFQTVFRGGKNRSVVKGKARIDGSYVLLEPTKFDGNLATMPLHKETVKFKFSSDWSTLTSSNGLALARKI